MARDFSKQFYDSKLWKQTREYILRRDNYLCCHCNNPAEEVHHIIHLTPQNINDLNICVNPENLISLCKDCHFAEHYKDKGNGHKHNNNQKENNNLIIDYVFDENGQIIPP